MQAVADGISTRARPEIELQIGLARAGGDPWPMHR